MRRMIVPIVGAALLSCSAFADRRETIELELSGAFRLPATLQWPSRMGEGAKYPVVLLFGGFQNAAKVLDLIEPGIPAVFGSFDYPFDPPRKFEFPGSLRHAADAKLMLSRTVEGISALARELKTRNLVDSRRIVAVGASLGAPFALEAAAADPALSGVVVIHGFGQVQKTARHQFLPRLEKRFGVLAHPMAWLFTEAAWLYLARPTPEESARSLRASQKVLMIVAEEDRFVPPSATLALWEALRESSAELERIDMPGDHLQPGSEKLIGEILTLTRRWMERSGLMAEGRPSALSTSAGRKEPGRFRSR